MRWLCIALLASSCVEYELSSAKDPVGSGEDTDPPLADLTGGGDDTDTDPVIDTSQNMDDPVDTSDPDVVQDTDPLIDTDQIDTAPPLVVATAEVYAHTSTTLYEVDPATGAYTLVGDFYGQFGPVDTFIDLAIDMNGHMIGANYTYLYQVDPSTAEVTPLCPVSVNMYALAFTSDGRLFAGHGTEIVSVDTTTCATTTLVTDATYNTSGDLVGLPDGYLYWTVWGEDGDDLIRVDPNWGYTTHVGAIGHDRLFGLGYDNGELYGFSDEGNIVRINPINASANVVATDSARAWWGAATNPVLWGP